MLLYHSPQAQHPLFLYEINTWQTWRNGINYKCKYFEISEMYVSITDYSYELPVQREPNSTYYISQAILTALMQTFQKSTVWFFAFCFVFLTTGAVEHTGEDFADAENSSQKRETPES